VTHVLIRNWRIIGHWDCNCSPPSRPGDHVIATGRRKTADLPVGFPDALKDTLGRLGITFIPEARGAGAGIRLKFSRKQSAGISSWETEGGETAEDSLP
jgi:hypothetical protein